MICICNQTDVQINCEKQRTQNIYTSRINSYTMICTSIQKFIIFCFNAVNVLINYSKENESTKIT